MSPVADDLEALMARAHDALGSFMLGDAAPVLLLFSQRDDVTLGNPFGPFVRGWDRVSETAIRAATHYRDGEIVGFERIAMYEAPDLACVVEVERYRAKVAESDEFTPVTLRVSSILRREGDGWRIVSRHADPITSPRSADSVIQRG